MMVNDSNETMVDNETEKSQKSLSEVYTKQFWAISESRIPYYKDCLNMTEMGARKPKRRWLIR